MEAVKTILSIINSLSALLLPAVLWIIKILINNKSALERLNEVVLIKLDNQQQQIHRLETRITHFEATMEALQLTQVKDFATHNDLKSVSEELKRLGEAMNKLAITQETMRHETLQGITQCYKDCHANKP